MAAITTATQRSAENVHVMRKVYAVVKTGVTIPHGALAQFVEATGRVTNASAVVNRHLAGIALQTKTGNTGGTVSIELGIGHCVKLPKLTALTKAYIGCNAAVSNNSDVTTASGAGTAALQCLVGRIVRLDGTNAWVEIGEIAQRNV